MQRKISTLKVVQFLFGRFYSLVGLVANLSSLVLRVAKFLSFAVKTEEFFAMAFYTIQHNLDFILFLVIKTH